ncbi:MAG: PepSY domain-containing protein [Acidobacteriota bacterium]|nr:PepSY domain-containing protein [Acidobacteriota bacterium]
MKRHFSSGAICLVLVGGAWGSTPSHEGQQAKLDNKAKITMAEAQKIALAKEPGKLKSHELEKENGKLIYSFDIKTKSGVHEVNVDAVSGEIVEDKVESAADEAKEKRQDKKADHSGARNPR